MMKYVGQCLNHMNAGIKVKYIGKLEDSVCNTIAKTPVVKAWAETNGNKIISLGNSTKRYWNGYHPQRNDYLRECGK